MFFFFLESRIRRALPAKPIAMFAGYAYFSDNGDGFVYALTHGDPTKLGEPVVVVNDVTRAANFFPFLFLVVGGVLTLLLLIIVSITFCSRRQVASLEEKYWRLQHAYAEVNDALVHEVMQRTPNAPPKRQPSMQRRSSTNSMRSQQQQQQQPVSQQMQSVPLASPNTYPRTTSPWTLTSDAVGVYPPRQSPPQLVFPASPMLPVANATAYDYNSIYTAAKGSAAMPVSTATTSPLSPQPFVAPPPIMTPSLPAHHAVPPQRQVDAASLSPETLRRRESKVRFL